MEVINYCTLFDSNYALQGLALLKSLIKTTGKDFHLFILALDEEIEEILIDFGLKNDSSCFTLLHLYDFERLNPDLLANFSISFRSSPSASGVCLLNKGTMIWL